MKKLDVSDNKKFIKIISSDKFWTFEYKYDVFLYEIPDREIIDDDISIALMKYDDLGKFFSTLFKTPEFYRLAILKLNLKEKNYLIEESELQNFIIHYLNEWFKICNERIADYIDEVLNNE